MPASELKSIMGFSYFYLVREDKTFVTASQGTDEHKLSMAHKLKGTYGT